MGTVALVEEPRSNADAVVGRDADEVVVVRTVVDRAERQPVPDLRS